MKFAQRVWAVVFCLGVAWMGVRRADAASCPVSFDPKEAYVGFTAYKFTEKLGVDGRFLKHQFSGKTEGASLQSVLLDQRVLIDGSSLETENPGRNATIIQGFFKNLVGGTEIRGVIEKVQGNDRKGRLSLKLMLNGKSHTVPMKYSVDDSGAFEATGQIDVLRDFQAKKSFDALHELCRELHKGADGISKTWSEVKIVVRSRVKRAC